MKDKKKEREREEFFPLGKEPSSAFVQFITSGMLHVVYTPSSRFMVANISKMKGLQKKHLP